ncbi:MAG: hypothetical protein KAX05_15595 [Bacteroidales bacterium]|nr:hypothetical protein [Bacteroidales bacterium]
MKTKIELTKMEALELIILLLDKHWLLDATINNVNEFKHSISPYVIPSMKNFKDEHTRTMDLINKIKGVFYEN